jgi:hypothetical protein
MLLKGSALIDVYADFKRIYEESGTGLPMPQFVQSFLKNITDVGDLDRGVGAYYYNRGAGAQSACVMWALCVCVRVCMCVCMCV